jgi:uncharacterized sulfatase
MKRNIVFFFSDQQRFDSLGVNGQALPVSPNLDRFAKEAAVNFTHAYTPQPVCGPARSCLQTGLYATQTGCFRNSIPLPEEIPTLAKRLKQAGYNVAYVGKWHLGIDEGSANMLTDSCGPTLIEKRGGYDDYWMASDLLEMTSHGYDGYVYDKDNQRVDFKGYRADCITQYGIDYIQNYESDKPFFLFISNLEPHQQNDHFNFEAPEGYRERFTDYDKPSDLTPGIGDWEAYYPDYLGCCHSLDENFQRVLNALQEKGFVEETMVIYTSDHGCHFRTLLDECTQGGYDDYKRNPFENSIHIPLLIQGAGFTPGHQEDRLVSLLDLPRTILTYAGCQPDETVQGRSLVDLDKQSDWDNAVYIQISESYVGRVLRTDRFKYVIYDPDKNPWNDRLGDRYRERYLFDLKEDPEEARNLVDDPGYSEIKNMLREQLRDMARQAGEGSIKIE